MDLIPQARSRFGPSVRGALSYQKGSYFLDESSKRRLVFQDQRLRLRSGTKRAPRVLRLFVRAADHSVNVIATIMATLKASSPNSNAESPRRACVKWVKGMANPSFRVCASLP